MAPENGVLCAFVLHKVIHARVIPKGTPVIPKGTPVIPKGTVPAHTPCRLLPLLQRADIWSAGIILYAMLFGQYPFDARDPRFARKVVTGAYSIPERVPVSHLFHSEGLCVQ